MLLFSWPEQSEQLGSCHSGKGKFPHHSQEFESFITSELTSLTFFRTVNQDKGHSPEITGWQNIFCEDHFAC